MSEIKEVEGKYYKAIQCNYDPLSGEWHEKEIDHAARDGFPYSVK